MSLKATVDTLADVPEALHSFYQEKDGKFNLTVEGLVPKARLDEFRDNNVTYKKQIDDLSARFKDVDPDKYKEMTDKEAKVRDKKLLEAGQVDTMIAERLAAMKADHDKVLTATQANEAAMKRQLEGLVIDGALRDAAMKAGVLPSAVDDVLYRGRNVFRLDGGKAVGFDGEKQIYGKDGEPIPVSEWVGSLSERAPHLFAASQGGNAPKGQTAAGAGGKKTMTRAVFDSLPGQDKMQATKDYQLVD